MRDAATSVLRIRPERFNGTRAEIPLPGCFFRSYDFNGNMTNDASYAYFFDAESRITQVNATFGNCATASACYTFDGKGMRVEKSTGMLYWRSPSGQTLAESDLSGNITNEYVFFAGRRAARRDNSGNAFYFFADHLGTTHTVTNSTGIPCYDTSFTPYGQEVLNPNVTSTCPPNYKFTGYELDSETGNHYAFARHYSQRLGRFLSPDPLGGSTDVPQSMNRYAYVLNMPVMAIDPSGMFVKSASPRPLCIPVLRNQPDDRKDWAVGDFGPYSDSEMEPDPPQNDCANALGQDANGFPSLGPSWSVDMPGLSIPSGLFGIAAAPNNNQIIGWVIDISEEINTYLDSNIEFCNLHPEICAAEIAYPELLNSRLLNAWTFPQLAPPTSSSVSIGPMKPAPKTPTTGSQFGEYAPALPLSAAANPYVMPAGAIPWAGQLGSLLPVFGQPFRPLGATASTPGMTGYTGDSTWGPAANGFHGWPWP